MQRSMMSIRSHAYRIAYRAGFPPLAHACSYDMEHQVDAKCSDERVDDYGKLSAFRPDRYGQLMRPGDQFIGVLRPGFETSRTRLRGKRCDLTGRVDEPLHRVRERGGIHRFQFNTATTAC